MLKLIISIILAIWIIANIVCTYVIYKKLINSTKNYEKLDKEAEELKDKYAKALFESKEEILKFYGKEIEDIENKKKIIEKEINEKTNFNNSLLKIREEELNRLISQKEDSEKARVRKEIDEWACSAQEAATENFRKFSEDMAREMTELNDECNALQKKLDEYQAKRDVINQEILRSRAIEENQLFYSVQLDSDSEHDIEVFEEIKPKIIKIEKLNKLIYDNYISKPVGEMVKRVLEGKNPTGIYKVTNLQTKEIYIGKSTSIADRWKNHIKSACGLSGVADSQFQRALKKYGIENFSWELLEETTKENLTEREKYWIMFYDTIHYGYNQRLG